MDNTFVQNKKLLLIDDHQELLCMMTEFLNDEGFKSILTAATMTEGLRKARAEQPDLVVLDIMLPDGDGFQLYEQLRTFTDIPVIFLTAKDEANNKLTGLRLGADDYIVKPFMLQELLLRIQAVLRRCYKEESNVLHLEGSTIDFSRAEVQKNGEFFYLTAKEQILLQTLARSANKIVTVDTVREALWGEYSFGYENSLNAHVRRIREKIERNPSKPTALITVKGLGYRLNVKK